MHAFVWVVNGQKTRFNQGTWNTLRLFNNMFPGFWENLLVVVKFLRTDPESTDIRGIRDFPFIEADIKQRLRREFIFLKDKPIPFYFANVKFYSKSEDERTVYEGAILNMAI